jgi:hypothetical protein
MSTEDKYLEKLRSAREEQIERYRDDLSVFLSAVGLPDNAVEVTVELGFKWDDGLTGKTGLRINVIANPPYEPAQHVMRARRAAVPLETHGA